MLNFLKKEGVYWEYKPGSEIHAKLTNGYHSDVYFNFSRLNVYSKFLYYLKNTNLLENIQYHIKNIDCICGQAYGSIFFANVLGSIFNKPVIFTEKNSDGQMCLNRYSSLDYNKIILLEDVISTGKTTLKTIECLGFASVYPVIISLVVYNNLTTIVNDNMFFQIIAGLNIGANFYSETECKMCERGSIPVRPKENWEFFKQ